MGTFCSRGTHANGNAIILACRDAKKKLYHLAEKRLKISPEEMDMEDAVIFEKANPDNKMAVSELFSFEGGVEEGGQIIGGATWIHPLAGNPTGIERDTYSYGSWGMSLLVNAQVLGLHVVSKSVHMEPIAAKEDFDMAEWNVIVRKGRMIGQRHVFRLETEEGITLTYNM